MVRKMYTYGDLALAKEETIRSVYVNQLGQLGP